MRQRQGLPFKMEDRSAWELAGAYILGSWLVLQVVDTLSSIVGLPLWFGKGVVILLVIGLPVLVVTALVQRRVVAAGRGTTSGDGRLRRWLTWRNAILSGVAAFALYGVVTAGYTAMRSMGIGPAGTLVARGLLDDRAAIILAEFDSQTGDTTLAIAVTEALRVDLGQSEVIRVVAPTTVALVLERMERSPDASLDFELAREVAVREGIPALVAGDISSVGRAFTITARLVSSQDGTELVSLRETARDTTAILEAMDNLSEKLRERIGESLRFLHGEVPLERVTSSSLEALRKYSQGMDAIDIEGDGPRGIALLREATALDSSFAMAWRKLGVVLGNRGQQRSEVIAALRRAFENGDRLPDRERYQASGTYHMFIGDYEGAIAAYESLVGSSPGDGGALNNLGYIHFVLRDYERAEQLARQAIAADTGTSIPYSTLMNSLGAQGRFEEVAELAEAGRARFGESFFIELNDAHALWAKGEHAAAEARFRDRRGGRQGDLFWRVVTAIDLAALHAARGRLDEATGVLEDAMVANEARGLGAEYVKNAIWIGLIDAMLRDRPEEGIARVETALARYPLDELDPLDAPFMDLAEFFVLAERPERAREVLRRYETAVAEDVRRVWRPSHHQLRAVNYEAVQAALALRDGRAAEAVELLRRSDRGDCSTCALPPLARAYEETGARDSAVAILERYLRTPTNYRLWWGDAYHLGPTLERLGRLHDDAGNRVEAAEYHDRFVELWNEADPELQPRVEAARSRLEALVAAAF